MNIGNVMHPDKQYLAEMVKKIYFDKRIMRDQTLSILATMKSKNNNNTTSYSSRII